MFGKIGAGELVLILAIALVIFGPKKLPEIGKALGQGLREFRQHTNDITSSIMEDDTNKKTTKETEEK